MIIELLSICIQDLYSMLTCDSDCTLWFESHSLSFVLTPHPPLLQVRSEVEVSRDVDFDRMTD